MSGGQENTLALKSDGTVWAWGRNPFGLGDSDSSPTFNSPLPVQVSNLESVTAIAAGDTHNMVLKSDGTVWAWGKNYEGQLGIGTSGTGDYRRLPEPVSGLSEIVCIQLSLALRSDGTVWAWGDNTWGHLGTNSNENSNVPVQVTGLSDITVV
ncbi:MAG TPA: hypothetical protein VGB77_03915, partial [Abditibacteriaceae bacterium]